MSPINSNISSNLFDRRTFCIVTGASRGIGKAISLEISKNLDENSILVVIARNEKDLDETFSEITAISNVKVSVRLVDFGATSDDELGFGHNFVQQILAENFVKATDFEQAILVHCAGTLGDLSKTVNDFESKTEIRGYFEVNVTSMLALNCLFWKAFKEDVTKYRYCINISSLCAEVAMKNTGLYCAGKAARDMLFKVMALEEVNMRVLNYAPGPVDTAMMDSMQYDHGDPDKRKWAEEIRTNKTILQPADTAKKFVDILVADKFVSGAHVDYYD